MLPDFTDTGHTQPNPTIAVGLDESLITLSSPVMPNGYTSKDSGS